MGHGRFITSQLRSPRDWPGSWLSSMHLFCNAVTAAQETQRALSWLEELRSELASSTMLEMNVQPGILAAMCLLVMV